MYDRGFAVFDSYAIRACARKIEPAGATDVAQSWLNAGGGYRVEELRNLLRLRCVSIGLLDGLFSKVCAHVLPPLSRCCQCCLAVPLLAMQQAEIRPPLIRRPRRRPGSGWRASSDPTSPRPAARWRLSSLGRSR